MTVPRPSFLVVGTARSGTTLVQRLAAELDGVGIGPESHFWSHAALPLLRRRRFPIGGAELAEEIERYLDIPSCRGLQLDVTALMSTLGGRATSIFELFAVIVDQLAGGAEVAGEKTPEHLLWWRPLSQHWPDLKLVWVVRDPRGVVASTLSAPVGMAYTEVIAERWRADQRLLLQARRELDDRRLLVVLHEEAVSSPDGVRDRMAGFLGLPDPGGTSLSGQVDAGSLHQSWETWKVGSDGPIEAARASAWRQILSPEQQALVDDVVGELPSRLGLTHEDGERPDEGAAGRVSVGRRLRQQVRRAHYRLGRCRLERAVRRLDP